MLAVIRELENWKHLLNSMKFKFKIWTNYKNLGYFIKVQKLNHRQAKQALYLSRFNFNLKYILEMNMEKPNRLSRRLDWKVKKDNENQKLIKKEWICSLAEIVIKGSEVDILEKIKIAREKDQEVVRVIKEIKKTRVKVLREDEWLVEGDLVLKEEKVYISKNKYLRVEII